MHNINEEIWGFWILILLVGICSFALGKADDKYTKMILGAIIGGCLLILLLLEKSQGNGAFAPEYTLKRGLKAEVLFCEKEVIGRSQRWNAQIRDLETKQTRAIWFHNKPLKKFEVGKVGGWFRNKQIEMIPIKEKEQL